ncbi:hypothetical protein ACQY0O_005849 [Thecaphora frezii]
MDFATLLTLLSVLALAQRASAQSSDQDASDSSDDSSSNSVGATSSSDDVDGSSDDSGPPLGAPSPPTSPTVPSGLSQSGSSSAPNPSSSAPPTHAVLSSPPSASSDDTSDSSDSDTSQPGPADVEISSIADALTCQPLKIGWVYTVDDAEQRRASLHVYPASSIRRRSLRHFRRRFADPAHGDSLRRRGLNETITPQDGVVLSQGSFVWQQVDLPAGTYEVGLSVAPQNGNTGLFAESKPFQVRQGASVACVPGAGAASSGPGKNGTASTGGGGRNGNQGTSSSVKDNQHRGRATSSGTIAAAVVVPIIAVLCLAIALLYCRRKRSQEPAGTSLCGFSGRKLAEKGGCREADATMPNLATYPSRAAPSGPTAPERAVMATKAVGVDYGPSTPIEIVSSTNSDEDRPKDDVHAVSLSRAASTASNFSVRRKPVPRYQTPTMRLSSSSNASSSACVALRPLQLGSDGQSKNEFDPFADQVKDGDQSEGQIEHRNQAEKAADKMPTSVQHPAEPEASEANIASQEPQAFRSAGEPASWVSVEPSTLAIDTSTGATTLLAPTQQVPSLGAAEQRISAATIQVSWQPGQSPHVLSNDDAGPVSASPTSSSFADAVQDVDVAIPTAVRDRSEEDRLPLGAFLSLHQRPTTAGTVDTTRTVSVAESFVSQCQVLVATRVNAPVGAEPVNAAHIRSLSGGPSSDTLQPDSGPDGYPPRAG